MKPKNWKKILPKSTYIVSNNGIGWSSFTYHCGMNFSKQYLSEYDSLRSTEPQNYNIISIIDVDSFETTLSKQYCIRSMISDRTLYQNKLIKPIRKGEFYYLEVYYKIGYDKEHNFDANVRTVLNYGGLGVLFSNIDYSKDEKIEELLKNVTKIKPRFLIKNEYTIKREWNKYSVIFQAESDYKYLILGNFNSLKHSDWYIDNTTLMEFESYINRKTIGGNKVVFSDVNFKTGSYTIPNNTLESLNIIVRYLKSKPYYKIWIKGHTDNNGNAIENQSLSNQRAEQVANYLIKNGIIASRIKYKGFGDAKPIANNKTEIGRKKNRRVEFVFYK